MTHFLTGPLPRLARIPALGAVALSLALTGCTTSTRTQVREAMIPSYEAENVHQPAELPAEVVRVAVLPVAPPPDVTLGELPADEFWTRALIQEGKFEAVRIHREDLREWFGVDHVRASETLPHGILQRIALHTAADAVMFMEVTSFSPYPPLNCGLRARLCSLDDGRILWAADELFDATNPRVAVSAKRHHADRILFPVPASSTALLSPRQFYIYAVDTLVTTIRPTTHQKRDEAE